MTFLLWHAVSGGQLLPGGGLLILNVVVLFFTLALPVRSFVHSCSSWQPLDHVHCVLRQWYHILAMLFRFVNGGNSLGTAGTAERENCRILDDAAATRAACYYTGRSPLFGRVDVPSNFEVLKVVVIITKSASRFPQLWLASL